MSLQLDLVEANLELLRSRVPDLPVTNIMLTRLMQHVGRAMGALFETKLQGVGMNEAEFRVLLSLYSQPDGVAHPSDLCACTAQSPANMSRITDALVERGVITRVSSHRDRRKLVLGMTEQGEDLVRRSLPPMYRSLGVLFEGFSEAEKQLLIEQMKRLNAVLERGLPPPPDAGPALDAGTAPPDPETPRAAPSGSSTGSGTGD